MSNLTPKQDSAVFWLVFVLICVLAGIGVTWLAKVALT